MSVCTSLLRVAALANPAPRTIAAAAKATPNVVFMRLLSLVASVVLTPSEELPIATGSGSPSIRFRKAANSGLISNRSVAWTRQDDSRIWRCTIRADSRRYSEILKILERAKGFEPSTPTLARSCSTPELHPHVQQHQRLAAMEDPPYGASDNPMQGLFTAISGRPIETKCKPLAATVYLSE